MARRVESPGQRVFVYGTLKPGGYYWPRFCEGKVEALLPAKVKGRLYHLPAGYPALVAGGEDWAHGQVLTFRSAADLAAVDGLEGYYPDGPADANEYDRVVLEAFAEDGATLGPAWSYVMEPARIAASGGTPVIGGDWKGKAPDSL